MARSWNTNATDAWRHPFAAVGRMGTVPAKRMAALAVVSGTTSMTGRAILRSIDHPEGAPLVCGPVARGH